MKFKFSSPPANLKTAFLSFGLFSFFTSFFCFHIYIWHLQKVTINSRQGSANTLIAEFTAGAPGTTVGSPSQCIPYSVASRFEPTTNYKQSETLPQWMKDYFDWHRTETLKINSCNYDKYRFLTMRCSNAERKCGGVADRLKSLPYYIAAAAKTKRIFMIRWQRPAKLEEFLLPNEINWSMPDWFYEKLDNFNKEHIMIKYAFNAKKIALYLHRHKDKIMHEGLLQDFYGGSAHYYKWDSDLDKNKTFDKEYADKLQDMAGWPQYEIIFRDLFYTLFEPTPPIAKLVKEKLISANLVPGQFSTSQYRAFYAIEHEKHVRTDMELAQKARNALNCASFMQPGDPVFFASDSQYAVRFAREMSETTDRKIVIFDDEKEAIHLDKRDQWKSGNLSDFFPTFVDLLIMGEARCMSHGIGGFGRFANMLSIDPSCVIRHDNQRVNKRHICKWHDSKEDKRSFW